METRQTWIAPIPTLIPDRVVLRLHEWGTPEDLIVEGVDEVRACLQRIWSIGPSSPELRGFLESRLLLEHGAATAVLAYVFSEELRRENLQGPDFLETALFHDAGLSFLPERFHEAAPEEIPDHLQSLFSARSILGQRIAHQLAERFPSLAFRVLRHHDPASPDDDPSTLLLRVCDLIDSALRIDNDEPSSTVLLRISHDLEPQQFLKMHHQLKTKVPLLFSELD